MNITINNYHNADLGNVMDDCNLLEEMLTQIDGDLFDLSVDDRLDGAPSKHILNYFHDQINKQALHIELIRNHLAMMGKVLERLWRSDPYEDAPSE